MKLSRCVKPISYLKAHAAELIRDVAETHDSVVITQNGEATAVLQSVQDYEELQESLALLKMIHQSRKSFDEGRDVSLRDAVAGVRREVTTRRKQRAG